MGARQGSGRRREAFQLERAAHESEASHQDQPQAVEHPFDAPLWLVAPVRLRKAMSAWWNWQTHPKATATAGAAFKRERGSLLAWRGAQTPGSSPGADTIRSLFGRGAGNGE